MILNSITLHNFMSYADAQLDLSAIGVACLAGSNGAGKSALLDALSWAIWEEARASSDDLIRIGQREMWVDVRFEHEGKQYRIRRSRQKGLPRGQGKGLSKGHLEFQVLLTDRDERAPALMVASMAENFAQIESTASVGTLPKPLAQDADQWRSLTGGNSKDTQRLIVQILRMDYDTFINSAYLRQGRADEFTMRQASDRKQILSEILGLSYFDQLQERSKEHIRVHKRQRELLEQLLTRLPELESALNNLTEKRSSLEKENQTCSEVKARKEEDAADLENRYQGLVLTREKVSSAQGRVVELDRDIKSLIEQKDELENRAAELDRLIRSQSAIEAEAKEYESLRAQVELLDQLAFKDQELRNSKVDLRSALADIRNRLELEHKTAKETVTRLEAEREALQRATAQGEKLKEDYAQFQILVQREAALAQKQEDFTRLTQRIYQLQSSVDSERLRLELDLEQKRNLVSENEDLLKSKDSLRQRQQELEEKTAALDKLEAELELTEQKGTSIKSTKESLALQIENLKQSKVDYESKIVELEESKNSSICPLCSSPIVDRAAVIARYRSLIASTDNEITSLGTTIARIEEELISHRQEYLRLKKTLDGRKELDKERGQFREKQATLERAEEKLSRTKLVMERVSAQIVQSDYAQVERESLLGLKGQLSKLDFDPVLYAGLQGQLRSQRTIEARYHQLQRDLGQLKKVEAELPLLSERVKILTGELAEESYGSEIRSRLHKVDQEIKSVNYDRELHSKSKQKLSALLAVAERFKDLNRAMEERPRLSESLFNCQVKLEAKTEQREKLRLEFAHGAKEIEQLPKTEADLSEAKRELEQARQECEKSARELAVVLSKQSDLKIEISALKDKQAELSRLKDAIDDYTFLAEAFGKKGIQAIIIENAIPEIESDANRLLSKLTDNQMHVKLETQQKNKSGTVVETLDILIADAIGTRNYELYSGGEAFKVNFAIRVALSRLLARRAGAKLETLIIDEGFGSQDEPSRDRLVRAIRSIQGDFAKILVITHFSDVREMFPTHILVSKTNGCSELRVS